MAFSGIIFNIGPCCATSPALYHFYLSFWRPFSVMHDFTVLPYCEVWVFLFVWKKKIILIHLHPVQKNIVMFKASLRTKKHFPLWALGPDLFTHRLKWSLSTLSCWRVGRPWRHENTSTKWRTRKNSLLAAPPWHGWFWHSSPRPFKSLTCMPIRGIVLRFSS